MPWHDPTQHKIYIVGPRHGVAITQNYFPIKKSSAKFTRYTLSVDRVNAV